MTTLSRINGFGSTGSTDASTVLADNRDAGSENGVCGDSVASADTLGTSDSQFGRALDRMEIAQTSPLWHIHPVDPDVASSIEPKFACYIREHGYTPTITESSVLQSRAEAAKARADTILNFAPIRENSTNSTEQDYAELINNKIEKPQQAVLAFIENRIVNNIINQTEDNRANIKKTAEAEADPDEVLALALMLSEFDALPSNAMRIRPLNEVAQIQQKPVADEMIGLSIDDEDDRKIPARETPSYLGWLAGAQQSSVSESDEEIGLSIDDEDDDRKMPVRNSSDSGWERVNKFV